MNAAAAVRAAAHSPLEMAAVRVLRRLRQPGAFLVVTRGAAPAAIFAPADPHAAGVIGAAARPVQTVSAQDVLAMLRAGWLVRVEACATSARFAITDAGRSWLAREIGPAVNPCSGRAPTLENRLRWSRDRARRRAGAIL